MATQSSFVKPFLQNSLMLSGVNVDAMKPISYLWVAA
jgi:hypothetical protein